MAGPAGISARVAASRILAAATLPRSRAGRLGGQWRYPTDWRAVPLIANPGEKDDLGRLLSSRSGAASALWQLYEFPQPSLRTGWAGFRKSPMQLRQSGSDAWPAYTLRVRQG